ncbi:FAD-binding oxidoreductase [Candidatus Woesearchaeota archaeon]|nr:FAD-binding oxidoreductase [Candidatus Woesearchaeota archaeon]
MIPHYHTLVIGGGCLGAATAISLARKLRGQNKVALIEKAVLGAGVSSRHSAIVRSANASETAARLALLSTNLWKNLAEVWGVSIPYETPGALWIGGASSPASVWFERMQTVQKAGVDIRPVDRHEANRLTGDAMRLDPDDIYFHEQDVLQLEAGDVLHALQTAVSLNGVEVKEHTQVLGFDDVHTVKTNRGIFHCDHLVNATGAWSPALMAQLGRLIPIAMEPVYVANWLVSASDLPENLPIIADYVNRAYFRRWRGSILHMHQPRQRDPARIAEYFSRSSMNPAGADVIYDATNFGVTQQQLQDYATRVTHRFPRIGSPLYAGGYVSFFDITPDLRFILGEDPEIPGLYHCLGGGQALKYAPVFGDLLSDAIVQGRNRYQGLDLDEFSMSRFSHNPLFSPPAQACDNRYDFL